MQPPGNGGLRFYGLPVSLPRQESLPAGTFHAIEDFSIDIGSLLGTRTAYVGFIGDTGIGRQDEDILDWTFAIRRRGRRLSWPALEWPHGCGANVPQCGAGNQHAAA